MNKINVVITYLAYPCTMAQYFINAFERRNDVELFTVGPYFGNWIPWKFGMELPQKYVKPPSLPLPKETARHIIHPQMIQGQLPKDIDLFLQIDAGWHVSSRPEAKIVALVETDPHVLSGNYQLPKSYSDYVFCMQTPYIQEGEIYLPYAVDQYWFYPEDLKQEYDVCLIGLNYDHRTRLVNALRGLGHKVYYDIGKVYDEYRTLYNQSKVAISWSSLQDMPVRVWEAFGMARPLVTNRMPDLSTFFVEDEHYLGFDDVIEGIEKVEYLLNNPEKADEIRLAAYRKLIHGNHTFDSRVQQILETVRLI